MRKTARNILLLGATLVGIPLTLAVILFAVGAYLYVSADFLRPNKVVDLNKYELSVKQDRSKEYIPMFGMHSKM